MKIQLASDLHLEFLQKRFPGECIIRPIHDADLLVLAGDIACGTQAIDLFKDWPVPVIYLAGNHEFYGQEFEETRDELRNKAEKTAIQFLDNDAFEFEGIRFLGATLWTDYRLYREYTQDQSMRIADKSLNDRRNISTREGAFSAAMVLKEHEQSRSWLFSELTKPFDGTTVVITHHGPHPLSVHRRYGRDPISTAFVSQLDELLPEADFWFHGHVHDSFDYVVDGCRVITNPMGYAYNHRDAASVDDLRFENNKFLPSLVIDVAS